MGDNNQDLLPGTLVNEREQFAVMIGAIQKVLA